MKTPREIILEQHRDAEPRLDAMREQVLAAELGRAAPLAHGHGLAVVPLKLWNELIWPVRHVWGGLAAVWAVLLVVHFSDGNAGGVAGLSFTIPSRESFAALEPVQLPELEFALRPTSNVEKPPLPAAPPPVSPKTSFLFSRENTAWA